MEDDRNKKVEGSTGIELEMTDFGRLWYFLGMEEARSEVGISVSQRKCVKYAKRN